MISGKFAESVLRARSADFFESQLASKRFEVRVVRVGQRHVRFMWLRPPSRNFGLFVMIPSLTAASATESLMVEHGCAPLESASF